MSLQKYYSNVALFDDALENGIRDESYDDDTYTTINENTETDEDEDSDTNTNTNTNIDTNADVYAEHHATNVGQKTSMNESIKNVDKAKALAKGM